MSQEKTRRSAQNRSNSRQQRKQRTEREECIRRNSASPNPWWIGLLAAVVPMVAVATWADWLQPSEIAILLASLFFGLLTTWVIIRVSIWRPIGSPEMVYRGVGAGLLALCLATVVLSRMHRSPETWVQTDRDIRDLCMQVDQLEDAGEFSDGAILLAKRIQSESSPYWLERWQVRHLALLYLEIGQAIGAEHDELLDQMMANIAAQTAAYGLASQADSIYQRVRGQVKYRDELDAVIKRNGNSDNAESSPDPKASEESIPTIPTKAVNPTTESRQLEIRSRVSQLAKSQDHEVTRRYLSQIVGIVHENDLDVPLGKWFVGNEIAWAKSLESPDARYRHYENAQVYAKSYGLDTAKIDRLLSSSDWQRKTIPIALPAGTALTDVARLKNGNRVTLRFSLVNRDGSHFTGLAKKDIHLVRNDKPVDDFGFTQLHQRQSIRPHNVLVLIDETASMLDQWDKMLKALNTLLAEQHDRVTYRFVRYSDTATPVTSWGLLDKDILLSLKPNQQYALPDLGQAICFAISDLSEREADRSLFVLTVGGTSSRTDSLEALIRRANDAEIQVSPVILPSSSVTCDPGLQQFADKTGGFLNANVAFVSENALRGMYELTFDAPEGTSGCLEVTIGRGDSKLTFPVTYVP